MKKLFYRKIQISGKKYKAHRVVMEKHLERKLEPSEIVYHIDGNIHNNNIENLEITDHRNHSSMHGAGFSKNKGRVAPNKITDTGIKSILKLHSKYKNYSKVAKIIGISNMTVRKYVLQFNSP